MNPDEIDIIDALRRCSFLPGSAAKKCVRRIYDRDRARALTDRQRFYLWAVAWSWRRQLPKELVDLAKLHSGSIGIRGPKLEAQNLWGSVREVK